MSIFNQKDKRKDEKKWTCDLNPLFDFKTRITPKKT